MPWVEPNEDTTLVADGVPPPSPPENPGILKTIGASFRQDNEVVSLYRRSHDEAFPPDPNYNPLPDIQNTPYFQTHADRFAGSHSLAETNAIKHRIDEEEADNETRAAAGFGGTLAGIAAGVLNPTTWLIPVGGELATATRIGASGLRAALRTGASFGAGAALSEGVLQGTHETRTWGESAANVATATLLGGTLGPATLARMSPSEIAAAETTLNADRVAMAEHAGDIAATEKLRQAASAASSSVLPSTGDVIRFKVNGQMQEGVVTPSLGSGMYVVETSTGHILVDPASMIYTGNNRPFSGGFSGNTATLPKADSPIAGAPAVSGRAQSAGAAAALRKATMSTSDEKLRDNVMKWQSGVDGGADVSMLPDAVHRFGTPTKEDAVFYRGNWPGQPDLGKEAGTVSVSDRAGGNSFGLIRNEYVLEQDFSAPGPHDAIPLAEIKVPAGTKMLDVGAMGGKNASELERMLPPGTYRLVGTRREPYAVGDTTAAQEIKTYQFTPEPRFGGSALSPLPSASAQGPTGTGGGTARSVGAAATDTRDVTTVRTILGTSLDRFDPMSRIFGAKSASARQAVADLAETPLRMEQNLEGIPTTSTGAPAISRVVTMVRKQREVAAYDEMHRLYTEYRFGDASTTFPRLRDKLQQFQGRAEGYMTFEQFDQEAAKAMRRGDQHEIPQVQQAAQFLRKHYDEWKDRAIAAKFFPEDVQPKGADSYLNRLWNKQAIGARRNEFVDKVTEYYRGDQTEKAAIQARLRGLNDELQAARDALGKAKTPEEAAGLTARHDELRGQIEAELGKWQGRSASAAKSALKAREKYAASRAAEKTGRLESADRAIDDWVQKVLESDRARPDAELRARAEETADRILSSADGRLSYETNLGGPQVGFKAGEPPRGPLAERRFAIPDATVEDFLEPSALHSHQAYLRTIVPDVLLTERYGDTAMTEAFRKINDDYTALRAGVTSEKTLKRLETERQRVISDLAAIRDRIRGVYGFSSEAPMRNAARVANAVKNYNTLSLMGMSAVSSLPDAAGAVFRHGLARSFGDAWGPFFRFISGGGDEWKQAARQFRAMGIATESFSAGRLHALADVTELYRPNSPVERALSWGADRFQLLNMLGPWTDWAKINSSMVAGSEILRATKAAAEGTLTKRQLAQLGESNIDTTMARRIWQSFQTSGEVKKGVHLPNTADWTDAAARQAFEGAVSREADIAVLTPGQEKPLWLSSPILSVLGQFKSFTLSATQRILLANLQRSDAQTLQGLVFSLGLGMLSYKLNNAASGRPTSERPQDWVKEAIDRGGLLGFLGEGNALAAKMTRGGVDVYRLIGADKPLSRYASRSVLDQLVGPTSGKIEALTKFGGAAATGEWNASDTAALRRLMATQNLFYTRRLFDEVEGAFNRQAGVPQH